LTSEARTKGGLPAKAEKKHHPQTESPTYGKKGGKKRPLKLGWEDFQNLGAIGGKKWGGGERNGKK